MIKGLDINAIKKGLRRQLEDHVRARLGAIRHVAYLLNRKLILDRRALGTAPWIGFSVSRSDETRRFVKSRGM